jgi:hypothetical protein
MLVPFLNYGRKKFDGTGPVFELFVIAKKFPKKMVRWIFSSKKETQMISKNYKILQPLDQGSSTLANVNW